MNRLLSLIIICCFSIACTAEVSVTDFVLQDIRDLVEIWHEEDNNIDSISVYNSYNYIYTSSNNTTSVYKINKVPIITIDELGFWRKDGQKTSTSLFYDPRQLLLCDQNNKTDLLGIIEGYNEWTFVFNDGYMGSFLKTMFSYNPDENIRGINHRGYNYLAPENTLPAFRLSRLKGFKFVETDIRFSLDGVPVILHDQKVDRTSNGKGDVSKMTWTQLRKLDFGGWKSPAYKGVQIPSLVEFLDLCEDINLVPYLELKDGDRHQIEQIVDIVKNYNLSENPVFVSSSLELIGYVIAYDKDAIVGLFVSEVNDQTIETVKSLNADGHIFISSSDYSESAASMCQSANIPFEVWTINTESKIQMLPSYTSGVISDCLHAGRILRKL